MKIKIKDIKPGGIEVAEQIPFEWIGLSQEDVLYLTAPLAVRAKARRVEDTILVEIGVASEYRSFCSRCLATVEKPWAGDFVLDYPIDRDTESVEIDEDIRQEVILNLPQKVLCREDCKGICPECRMDLNKGECEHSAVSHKS